MHYDLFIIFIAVAVLLLIANVGRYWYEANRSTSDNYPPVKNPIPPGDRYDIFGAGCMECGKKIEWSFYGPTIEEVDGTCDCKVWHVDTATYKPYWERRSSCEK